MEVRLNERELNIVWALWTAIALLSFAGLAFIYSAATAYGSAGVLEQFRERSTFEFLRWLIQQFYTKQAISYLIGLTAAFLVCLVDYRRYARWSLVLYWISIGLLILVLTPLGGEINGAKRWIDLGFFNFQPSEFAKLSFLVALANYLSRPEEELKFAGPFFQGIAMAGLPFILILKEPDLGSALVLLPIAVAMMWVAGVPLRYLGSLVGGGAVLVAILLANVLFAPPEWRIPLEQYQRERLLVYFKMDFAPPNATEAERERARKRRLDKEYNIEQALISVGSGGLTGKGWQQGTQTGLGYLPRAVAHNDFIFSVIAEEKGFLGSVTIIGLYTLILLCGIRIAGQARDRLGKLLATGVVTMLFSHIFINIGMNVRMMPVTGIPLPLLSYGGTSVLCTMVAAGILQNIHLYRKVY